MARRRAFRLALLVCPLLVAGVGGADVRAQEQQRRTLEQVQAELSERAADQREMAEKARKAGQQAEALSRKLAALAADIQASEERAEALERDIRVVTRRQNRKRADLADKREQMVDTLAALERLSRQPPELALIRPGQALDVVRGGQLLATILPTVEQRARDIAATIGELRAMRTRLADSRARLDGTLASLADRRRRLARLIAERREERDRLKDQAAAEQQRVAQLAAKAESLESLIDRLEAEQAEKAALVDDALDRLTQGRPGPDGGDLAGLPTAQGDLPLPARGPVVRRFGAAMERGEAQGITIRTRPGAQVVAPYDGRVLFAGPYKGYGRLLIIDHGEGYLSVLAGMNRLYTQESQWVLAGEPVGAMTETPEQGTSAGPAGGSGLYLELRRSGKPVDPLPWLAADTEQVG